MARKNSEQNLVFARFHTQPKKATNDRRRAEHETLQNAGIHCGFSDMHRGDQRFTVPQINTKLQDIKKIFMTINSIVRHALQEVT
jgi:hypothetical protein